MNFHATVGQTDRTERDETKLEQKQKQNKKMGKHQPCSHPGEDACKRRITAKSKRLFRPREEEEKSRCFGFPEFLKSLFHRLMPGGTSGGEEK